MKRQLQGIAIILVCILLTLGFGNESVFDPCFRWSVVFAAGCIVGAVMTFLPDKKKAGSLEFCEGRFYKQ